MRAELPEADLPFGALTTADVMLAGFRAAKTKFDELIEFADNSSEEAKHPGPDLDWGTKVAQMFAWAKEFKSSRKQATGRGGGEGGR